MMEIKETISLNELNLSDEESINFIRETYEDAFPLSERRPFQPALDLHQDSKQRFSILLIKIGEQKAGLFTFWDLGDFIFIEHFAIAPEARNGGIGKKVMELFMKEYQKPLILEVELPTTILSERRIGFYQRLGFKLWENIKYHQPSYQENGNPIPMKLMSYRAIDVERDYISIKDKIYKEVYNC